MKPSNYVRVSRLRRVSIFGFLLVSCIAIADTYTGRVVGVADGDTVTVLDSTNTQHKVRLSGIDAPEKKQAFGQISKQHLADLVFGKLVTIETRKRDRDKRELGKVTIDGRDANLNMLQSGLAWYYKKYANNLQVPDRQSYAAAEVSAQQRGQGLWQDANPVPPWDFRHQKKGHQLQ